MASGLFPKPITIGKTSVRWRYIDLKTLIEEENKMLKNKDIKALVPTTKTYNKSCGTGNGLIIEVSSIKQAVQNALLEEPDSEKNKQLFILDLSEMDMENYQLYPKQIESGKRD